MPDVRASAPVEGGRAGEASCSQESFSELPGAFVTYPDWNSSTPGSQPGQPGPQPGQPVPPQGGWGPGQPGQPGQPPVPPPGWAPGHPGAPLPPQPQQKSGAKKLLAIGGPIVVAGVIGVVSLTRLVGGGDPDVGDCITQKGEASWEVVDCGSDEAQFKVVGIEDEQQTEAEFDADPDSCGAFAAAEVALWSGMESDAGTVFCAAPV
jgi:hypothetical protein